MPKTLGWSSSTLTTKIKGEMYMDKELARDLFVLGLITALAILPFIG